VTPFRFPFSTPPSCLVAFQVTVRRDTALCPTSTPTCLTPHHNANSSRRAPTQTVRSGIQAPFLAPQLTVLVYRLYRLLALEQFRGFLRKRFGEEEGSVLLFKRILKKTGRKSSYLAGFDLQQTKLSVSRWLSQPWSFCLCLWQVSSPYTHPHLHSLCQQVFHKHTDSLHSNSIDKTYWSCCCRPQDVTVYWLFLAKLHVTYISPYLR